MAGGPPADGGTTRIGTSLIPLNFVLDGAGCADADGKPARFGVEGILYKTLNSPDFQEADYETGYSQYSDAIQRANFFKVAHENWHTRLRSPDLLTPVTIEVPPQSSACLFIPPTGKPFGVVDSDFFSSQLETIFQLEPIRLTSLAIVLSRDVFLYDGGNISNCCVLGFHGAGPVLDTVGNPLQTFAWASWISAEDSMGTGWEDILGLSHEIMEWMDDPFLSNVVPPWQIPDGSGTCAGNILEAADPIEAFSDPSYPVMIDGYTYHPQNIALLPWFSREKPSTAIDGAYSFPNEGLLTLPSQACR